MAKPSRKDSLLAKKAQIEAQLKQLDARERQAKRKADTRRKIIAGALALEHAEHDPAFAATLNDLIERFVTKPAERELFGLEQLAPANERSPSSDQANAAK